MDRLFIKLIGLVLLLFGLYYLGKNVFFASTLYAFWRSVPAIGSLLCLTSGVVTLIFFRRTSANVGWVLLTLGILLIFFSGGAYLLPTSLWHFLVAFTAVTVGFKLFTEERIRF